MIRSTAICTLLALTILLVVAQALNAQYVGIHQQVNVDQFGNNTLLDAANEPSIAINPLNPNQIAIGWRQFDDVTDNFRQAGVAFSTDGGASWTATTLDPGQFRSDPVLDFDANGNFYYSSLSSLRSMEVFKSTDGGANWSSPIPAFGGDKQWIAIDRTSGIGSGNIYQHWNVQFTETPGTNFTRSTNGGTSYETVISGPRTFMKWGAMDVGPDGTLYLGGSQLNRDAGHLFSKSTNAKDPLAIPSFTMSSSVDLGGTTSFGGVNPAGLLGQVNIAADHSQTASNGNIYMLGSVDPPGSDPLDVTFVRSEDGGGTWSEPITVNNDASGTDAYQWFGAMSVAPNGRIDSIWNDTRADATDTTSELYYAYSLDAGVTWLGNIAVSAPFDQSLGYPNQDKLGDYYDMVSDNTGVNVAYAATFNGEQDVYFMRIAAVPEPSTVVLIALGACLCGTFTLRRRRRIRLEQLRAARDEKRDRSQVG